MEQPHDPGERLQWSFPVLRISTYAASAECRYGFIITDQHLVVLRVSWEPVGLGSAAAHHLYQRILLADTDLSSAEMAREHYTMIQR